MELETVVRFRMWLEQEKLRILASAKAALDELSQKVQEKGGDEGDEAQSMAEQHLSLRFKERERLLLRKVEEALDRIKAGSFGLCEDCGDDIDVRRLNARPMATLCVTCKEIEEKKEREFSGEA